jgi:hypothetical protein
MGRILQRRKRGEILNFSLSISKKEKEVKVKIETYKEVDLFSSLKEKGELVMYLRRNK